MKKLITFIITIAIAVTPFYVFAADETINVQVNEVSVYADGKYIDSDNFLYRDRTFIPLRGVLESLNCEVFYNEEDNSVNSYNSVEMVLDAYRIASDAYQSIKASDYQMTISYLLFNLNDYDGYKKSCELYTSNKNSFDSKYSAAKGIVEIGKYSDKIDVNLISEKTTELLEYINNAYVLGIQMLYSADDTTSAKYSECLSKIEDSYAIINNIAEDFGFWPY